MNKDVRRILKKAEGEGATVENGSKHLKVRCPGGLVTVARTASDKRAFKNMVADLRRHGLKLEGE